MLVDDDDDAAEAEADEQHLAARLCVVSLNQLKRSSHSLFFSSSNSSQ